MMPKSVRAIGKNCFGRCHSLSEIKFQEGTCITNVAGIWGLWNDPQYMMVMDAVEMIPKDSFSGIKSLECIVFGTNSRLKKICAYAFKETSLRYIQIPRCVTHIEAYCFLFCGGVATWELEIEFQEGTCISNVAGVNVSWKRPDEIVIPREVEEIPDGFLAGFLSLQKVSFQPESRLRRIGSQAFLGTNIVIVTLPKGIEEIGDHCFAKCRFLRKIVFEEGACPKKLAGMELTWIDPHCVMVPKCVKRLPMAVFCGFTSLQTILFEKGSNLEEIESDAFACSGLRSLTIPRSVKSIGVGCFASCTSFCSLKFEEGTCIRELGKMNVFWTDPRRIVISKDVKVITERTFSGMTQLKEVVFEEGSNLEKIKSSAFSRTGLVRIQIPRNVECIDDECFYGCQFLSEITFEPGTRIKTLGRQVFDKTPITRFDIPKSMKELAAGCFLNDNRLQNISFELGTRITCVAGITVSWTNPSHIVIPKEVVEIPCACFADAISLKEIVFERESRCKKISQHAFTRIGIKMLTLPRSVEVIDVGIFGGIESVDVMFEEGVCIKRIGDLQVSWGDPRCLVIPKEAEEIPDEFLYGFKSLQEVIFVKGSKVKRIGETAFMRTGLKKIEIPRTMKSLGNRCFANYDKIEITLERGTSINTISGMNVSWNSPQHLVIPAEVEEIAGSAFYGCAFINQISFAESNVRRIGEYGFAVTGIRTFTVPMSVLAIEAFCFFGCDNLQQIRFEEGTCIRSVAGMRVEWTDPRRVTIPKDVERIPQGCFHWFVSLEELLWEEQSNIKVIERGAFVRTGLKALQFPESLAEIGQQCFNECYRLSEVTFNGYNVTRVDTGAFYDSPVSSLYLPREGLKELMGLLITGDIFGGSSGTRRLRIHRLDERDAGDNGNETPEDGDVFDGNVPLSDFIIDIEEYKRIRALGTHVFLYQKDDSLLAMRFIKAVNDSSQIAFHREIRALQELSHPFVITLSGISLPCPSNQNSFVVATEYMKGNSLKSATKLDNTTKSLIIYAVAIGMTYIHSKGIIHRDLRPDNILLDENNLPRICNFGWSQDASDKETLFCKKPLSDVESDHYRAPELYTGSECTEKADVYSFGVILYELLTGTRAFGSVTSSQNFRKAVIPEGSVTPFGIELITSCWADDPENRPSFSEICTTLKNKIHLLFSESELKPIMDFVMKYGIL